MVEKDMSMKDNVKTPEDAPALIRSRGLRIPNDPAVIDQKKRRLLRRGEYERREVEAVKALVRPEDVVLELGGGLGYMSTFMSHNRKVGAVHTYEANPALIPFIQRVHAENGVENVTIHNALLGSRKGKAKFYVRENFLASSMEENPEGEKSPVVQVEEIEVENAKAAVKAIKPTFLVCDIEGAEADILPLPDFSGLRGAVIELHPQWIGAAGVRAVFDAMHKAGLTFFPRVSNKKVVAFLRDW